ncbi:nickel pincer cofactor biosynthesis protein LarB [Fundidesulfovibrio butyratiphilus]
MSVTFDHARTGRIGLPESVYCAEKPFESIVRLAREFGRRPETPVLFTRLAPEIFDRLPPDAARALDYHPLSRTAMTGRLPFAGTGRVAVVSAGTSDGPAAWEAARTLEHLGVDHTVVEDVGVAGLWRLTSRLEEINAHHVVIVTAGMDAALASVLGGLTPRPLVAVPTSVGYGVAAGGQAALSSMLSSCAPGVCVVNIDNGYGAACAAVRILRTLNG